MELIISKEELEEKLILASRFISTKTPSIRTIQGCYISIKKSGIRIITTNLNDFLSVGIKANIKKEGEVVFDIKKTLEFLGFLNTGEVQAYIEENNFVIQQGKTKGYFNIFPKEDFPPLPTIEGEEYKFSKEQLDKTNTVLFSASKDETRPILTGVYFSHSEGKTSLVTTDGFRLSLFQEKRVKGFPETIIPANIISEIIKLTKKGKEVLIRISTKQKLIVFEVGEVVLYSRILEGEFPPFEKVIPKISTTQIEANKQDLIKNLRLISVFARDQSDVVILDIQREGLYLRPKFHQTKKTEIFQELNSFKGEKIKIAFNYKYILDFLNNIDSPEVIMEFSQSVAPGVFRTKKDEGFIHIIMPLRTEETTE